MCSFGGIADSRFHTSCPSYLYHVSIYWSPDAFCERIQCKQSTWWVHVYHWVTLEYSHSSCEHPKPSYKVICLNPASHACSCFSSNSAQFTVLVIHTPEIWLLLMVSMKLKMSISRKYKCCFDAIMHCWKHSFNTFILISLFNNYCFYASREEWFYCVWYKHCSKYPTVCGIVGYSSCSYFPICYMLYWPIKESGLIKQSKLLEGSGASVKYTTSRSLHTVAWGDSSQTAWFRSWATGKQDCLGEREREKWEDGCKGMEDRGRDKRPINYTVKWSKGTG